MKIVKNPNKSEWKELLSRPALSVEGLYERVQAMLDTVRKGGDKALKESIWIARSYAIPSL